MLSTQELPSDVEQLQLALQEARQKIAVLQQQIQTLQKLLFAPRTEQRKPPPPDLHARQGMLLFPELAQIAQRVADETQATGSIEVQAHVRQKKGRRREFPEHLPRIRTTYELPAEQRQCCGRTMEEMGEETSQELERLEICVVHEIARKKYCCRVCQEAVRTAPGPGRVIDKGLLGVGFLSQMLVERFGNHQPYHRLEKKYQSEGLSLSRSVLCSSAGKVAELLQPVWEALHHEVKESPVVQFDDTTVTIQEASVGGRKTGYVAVYGDREGRQGYVFGETRSRAGPLEILGHRRGYAQADALKGYDTFFRQEGVVEIGCWAHARRYFVKAQLSDPQRSAEALRRIGKLYAVEKEAKEQELDAAGVRQLRQECAGPLLQRLQDWLTATRIEVLDQSPLATAIDYAQGQWQALVRYLEDGRIEIDNNRSERALRAVVIGRKNWLQIGNERGGQTAAVLYSLVQTSKAIGVDPREYLRDVLLRLRRNGADPRELTPHRWREKYEPAVRDERNWVLARLLGKAE